MKTINSNFFLSLFALVMLGLSGFAYAIDLPTAKQQGLVGETSSGYLEPVSPASTEVRALVSSINDKRKQKYEEIARRNGTTLSAVEVLAGKKAIEKSKPGTYIKPAGSWVKK